MSGDATEIIWISVSTWELQCSKLAIAPNQNYERMFHVMWANSRSMLHLRECTDVAGPTVVASCITAMGLRIVCTPISDMAFPELTYECTFISSLLDISCVTLFPREPLHIV